MAIAYLFGFIVPMPVFIVNRREKNAAMSREKEINSVENLRRSKITIKLSLILS